MITAELSHLAVVILLAAGLGVLARFLKQPLILAYIITGSIIGYFGYFNIGDAETFRAFSDLGIMFLLFLVGLEINYTSLRLVGRTSLIVGLGQIIFTSLFGFWIARGLGFDSLPSLYIAIALTFSSTIIIVKLLSEKRDLNSLYGKISIGFLLIQDFVAILILLALAGVEAGAGWGVWNLVLTTFKGVALFALMLWLGRKVLPFLFDRAARSGELLFLISLAWLFLVTAVVSRIGFSIEIAGFLAGLALANSSEHHQIASRLRSLRDFFILIFFALLGASVVSSTFTGLGWPIIIFSAFVLIGNPLIVLVLMGILGYRRRTSFLTGLTVAQISEFSLILAALGYKLGHLSAAEVSLITAVGIITITASTYLILYADNVFRVLRRLLSVFERRKTKEDGSLIEISSRPVILIGAHRTGQSIAANLPADDLLIIDSDPEVVAELKKKKIAHIFGDISDIDIFERVAFEKAKLVISTTPHIEDNLLLLSQLKSSMPRPKVIVRAETEAEARILYENGADYVLLPHFTSGQYLGKTIAVDLEMKILEGLKRRDQEMLRHDKMPYGI